MIDNTKRIAKAIGEKHSKIRRLIPIPDTVLDAGKLVIQNN